MSHHLGDAAESDIRDAMVKTHAVFSDHPTLLNVCMTKVRYGVSDARCVHAGCSTIAADVSFFRPDNGESVQLTRNSLSAIYS